MPYICRPSPRAPDLQHLTQSQEFLLLGEFGHRGIVHAPIDVGANLLFGRLGLGDGHYCPRNGAGGLSFISRNRRIAEAGGLPNGDELGRPIIAGKNYFGKSGPKFKAGPEPGLLPPGGHKGQIVGIGVIEQFAACSSSMSGSILSDLSSAPLRSHCIRSCLSGRDRSTVWQSAGRCLPWP